MNGVYVHIPFCMKKCGYCDFVSYENRLSEGEAYIKALLTEMQSYRGERVDTVYIGGGTPTVLPPHLLLQLLSGLQSCFAIAPGAEITVEANPGTCNGDGLKQLAEAGVNRISLGVQSFIDAELALLGRIHTAEDAVAAAENAYAAGITNLSLDLMFSIPAQTQDSLRYSIEQAAALRPTHISAYSLTLCEGTPFFSAAQAGQLSLPDEEEDRARYTLLCEMLKNCGYRRYEISNFAKPGFEARHNTKYWIREPYIGLGAAAHSFYNGRRFENPASLAEYYQTVYNQTERMGEMITRQDAMAEFMFLGLRRTETGISRNKFFKEFKQPIDSVYGEQLTKLCRLKLLELNGDTIRLTERGIDVSNSVFCEFV